MALPGVPDRAAADQESRWNSVSMKYPGQDCLNNYPAKGRNAVVLHPDLPAPVCRNLIHSARASHSACASTRILRYRVRSGSLTMALRGDLRQDARTHGHEDGQRVARQGSKAAPALVEIK